MRVFVTGGAGFIGANLVQGLLAAGHVVGVVDDLSTGSAANIDPRSEFRTMDILDPAFPALLAQFRPDAVVHLAAQSNVAASLRDPDRDWAVNAEGTRVVAEAARAAGARRILSASSAAVYGDPAELPLRETSPTEPISPYGRSKLAAEGLLSSALSDSETDHASMRFSNVYGPRQDAEGEGGVVAVFCARVRAGEPPVVFGDGSQTRDFVYVGDIVGAIMAALAYEGPLAREDGAAYNLSTGTSTRVDELVGAVRIAAGYFGATETAHPRAGDIAHSVLDPSRALGVFGWKAGVDLETGIGFTWRWFASRGG